ncbi:MAG: ATP phosphoribosyltransferase regulatory subunit [Limnochordia bacterium]
MNLRTPRGVKDFLPLEAEWKLELERKIRSVFHRWGYQEVISPTFEFYDLFAQGSGDQRQAYRFFDQNGDLLVLRSDLTTPIARMVATRLKDEAKPLRLGYIANVFRYDEVQVGFQREFYQAGVELLGSSSAAADAEAAALAVTIFNQVGVSGFKLDLGHTGYIQGVLSECPTQPVRERIWQLLRKKDLVGLKAAVMTGDLPEHVRVLLLNLPHARGGAKLLEEAYAGAPNEMARNAAANLREIYARLHDYGLGAQTEIDLGMVKSFGYYTGMVLEGYVTQVGFTLCSGGRYDQLGMGFGSHLPAVGFALGLERLMLALELQGLRPEAKSGGVLILPRSWPHALEYAAGMRDQGIRVEVDTENRTEAEAAAYARQRQFARVVVVDAASIRELPLDGEEGSQC